jgi:hypothetical protein
MSKPNRPEPFPSSIQRIANSRQTRAPTPYKPQGAQKCLQSKPATPRPPAAGRVNCAPPAPPVYRPQATPKVLQRKAAISGPPPAVGKKHPPAAPPVYRPQVAPKVLQRKVAGAQQRPPSAQPTHSPVAPPVYRPQAAPRVLQTKVGGGRGLLTRPNVSGNPTGAGILQRKSAVAPPATRQMGPSRSAQMAPVLRRSGGSAIQLWKSKFTDEEIPDDKWLISLVNENASLHGHTVLVLQGQHDGRLWNQTVNFYPAEKVISTKTVTEEDLSWWDKMQGRQSSVKGTERELTLSEKLTGRRFSVGQYVPGVVDERTGMADPEDKVCEPRANEATNFVVTPEVGSRVQGIINEERNKVRIGEAPVYATVGDPMNLVLPPPHGVHNCHTWAVDVLKRAGIEVPSSVDTIMPNSVGADRRLIKSINDNSYVDGP